MGSFHGGFVGSLTAWRAPDSGMEAVTEAALEGSGPMGIVKKMLAKAKAVVGQREFVATQLAKIRVLSKSFFNPMAFSKPVDRAQCLARIRTNVAQYKLFYAIVFVALLGPRLGE